MSGAIQRFPREASACIICTFCISWLLASCGSSTKEDVGSSTGTITSEALSEPGPFVAGFQFIKYVDTTREAEIGGRTVPVFLFCPADAKSVTAATPLASYPLDPVWGTLPEVSASEYVAVGDDPAYSGVPPSRKKGRFPLVIFSPGNTFDATQYIFAGTRLASHGIVVASLFHVGEGSLSIVADPSYAPSILFANRPKDMSFVLTSLIGDPRTRDLFDPAQVLAAGHSLGGYAAWALAGGDDNICDTVEWAVGEPQPEGTCVPITPDPRFRAVISLDGANDWLTAAELARVRVPSLGVGQTEAAALSTWGRYGWSGRPHAFIGPKTKYRIDVNHATHDSFTDACANFDILTRAGAYPNERMPQEFIDFLIGYICTCPTGALGGDCVIDARLGHDLTTKYMIAFINTYVAHGPGRNLLVPKCGQKQEANIDLFTTEVGGNYHLGPNTDWLAPVCSAEQFDYYVNQADVPCEDEQ